MHIKDTLKEAIGVWDDPGDYPNSLAAGPLPSRKYVEEIDGAVTIDLTAADILTILAYLQDNGLLEDALDFAPDLAFGSKVEKWNIKVESEAPVKLSMTVAEFEGGEVYIEHDNEEY